MFLQYICACIHSYIPAYICVHMYMCTYVYSYTVDVCILNTYVCIPRIMACLLCVGICYIQWIVKERPYLCHGQSEIWKYVLYAQSKCIPYAMGVPYAVCMPHVYRMLWIAIR